MNGLRIALIMISASLLAACSDDKAAVDAEIRLSADSLTLAVGESANVTVACADRIAAACADTDVATATVAGNVITVTGHRTGHTDIQVAHSRPGTLTIDVTVTAATSGHEGFDKELADNTSRYVSRDLTMRYGTPGIMVSRNGENIGFVDITTGDKVTFDPTTGSLMTNGRAIPLSYIKCERTTPEGDKWYDLTRADTGAQIVIVISDL